MSVPVPNPIPAAEANSVSIRYGKKRAVENVSLTIATGSVYALLGRNGSGKSSLVRTLVGQQRPSSGETRLLGEDAWKHRTRLMDRVGVVPEEGDAPPEMKVRQLAEFSARVFSRWSQSGFEARMKRFGIATQTRFGDLSKGQKKQVSLALTLAASPELLILDDPTLGLDVVARKSLFEEVIAEMAERGVTVLIATHDLAPVEAIADRVGILKNGQLVLDEEIEALKQRFRRIRFAAQPMELAQANLIAAEVRRWGNGTEAVVSNYDDLEFARLRERVTAEVSPMSLEEIFIAVAGEDKDVQS